MKNAKIVADELEKLINHYALGDKLSVKGIQDWVYNDNGESSSDASNKFLMRWTKFFGKEFEQDTEEFNGILEIFTDAWNYFPHKSLNGKSPHEKYIEFYGRAPEDVLKESKRNSQGDAMPIVNVGGVEMSWGQHQAMLAEMEKAQRPFKKFIDKLKPAYKDFLEKQEGLSKKIVEKHEGVAQVFFDRVLWVGFVDFLRIRDEFIEREFPHWWQTHVMFLELKEQDVVSSIEKLLRFIEAEYGISHSVLIGKKKLQYRT